jgi:ribosome-binding ATPase YchF (GTP1/OBG family)
MELSQMDPAEEQEFREGLGAGESGLDRMVRLTHDAGDLVTFFTGNPNEVRAWTVPRGTTALKAAGKVHSDFERGFIRAEVVGFDDLDGCGSMAEARRRGVLRQEGKDYLVGDGDVLNILFNV